MHYESLSLVFLCHHYERYSRDVRNPSFRSMVVKMFTLNVMRTQTKTKNVSLLRTALMDIITKSRIVLDLSYSSMIVRMCTATCVHFPNGEKYCAKRFTSASSFPVFVIALTEWESSQLVNSAARMTEAINSTQTRECIPHFSDYLQAFHGLRNNRPIDPHKVRCFAQL